MFSASLACSQALFGERVKPPSLSSLFFHSFPTQIACSQASAFRGIKFVKTSLIGILMVQDSDCSFGIRVVIELKINQKQ